jgi:hypothetical protein
MDRDLVPRLRLWAREHPVRAWICVAILVLLALLIVSLSTGWGTTVPGTALF